MSTFNVIYKEINGTYYNTLSIGNNVTIYSYLPSLDQMSKVVKDNISETVKNYHNLPAKLECTECGKKKLLKDFGLLERMKKKRCIECIKLLKFRSMVFYSPRGSGHFSFDSENSSHHDKSSFDFNVEITSNSSNIYNDNEFESNSITLSSPPAVNGKKSRASSISSQPPSLTSRSSSHTSSMSPPPSYSSSTSSSPLPEPFLTEDRKSLLSLCEDSNRDFDMRNQIRESNEDDYFLDHDEDEERIREDSEREQIESEMDKSYIEVSFENGENIIKLNRDTSTQKQKVTSSNFLNSSMTSNSSSISLSSSVSSSNLKEKLCSLCNTYPPLSSPLENSISKKYESICIACAKTVTTSSNSTPSIPSSSNSNFGVTTYSSPSQTRRKSIGPASSLPPPSPLFDSPTRKSTGSLPQSSSTSTSRRNSFASVNSVTSSTSTSRRNSSSSMVSETSSSEPNANKINYSTKYPTDPNSSFYIASPDPNTPLPQNNVSAPSVSPSAAASLFPSVSPPPTSTISKSSSSTKFKISSSTISSVISTSETISNAIINHSKTYPADPNSSFYIASPDLIDPSTNTPVQQKGKDQGPISTQTSNNSIPSVNLFPSDNKTKGKKSSTKNNTSSSSSLNSTHPTSSNSEISLASSTSTTDSTSVPATPNISKNYLADANSSLLIESPEPIKLEEPLTPVIEEKIQIKKNKTVSNKKKSSK